MSFLVTNAASSGGTPGFYFLPPMVPQPALAGALDPTLAPTATVTRVDGGETAVVTLAATLAGDHYQASWDTRAADVDPGLYRIRVHASGKLLGFADVRIVETGAAARNVNTDEEIPLVDNRTLPIKVWIDAGAVDKAQVCAGDADCAAGFACTDLTCIATCMPGGVNDPDGDGICAGDVCPAIADDQHDLDGDGAGDVCDADADGDGFTANDCDDRLAARHPVPSRSATTASTAIATGASVMTRSSSGSRGLSTRIRSSAARRMTAGIRSGGRSRTFRPKTSRTVSIRCTRRTRSRSTSAPSRSFPTRT